MRIHLVALDVDGSALARAESCLAPAELVRARRGSPPVQRRRIVLRAALRSAVAAELGIDPARVPLRTTPAGRPYVDPVESRWFLDVNCSASGTLGIVAVGRACRVGVDMETVAPWSPDVLVEGWLSPGECRQLAELPPAARPVAVARCWTRKEAVLKARGTGLLEAPSAVVTPVGGPAGIIAGWAVEDLRVPAGWVASLAVGRPEELPA